jgi:hypothetical protein
MIKLKQPALALHACDVPGYHYKMQTTWLMDKGASASQLVFWIDWAIRYSDNQRLENVVINCHGTPGFLHIGGSWSGFGIEGVKLFEKFKETKAVGTIWLVACRVVDSPSGSHIGEDFCSALARASGAKVIASRDSQRVEGVFDFFRPNNCIDSYEGGALAFYPDGSISNFINDYSREF